MSWRRSTLDERKANIRILPLYPLNHPALSQTLSLSLSQFLSKSPFRTNYPNQFFLLILATLAKGTNVSDQRASTGRGGRHRKY